jgi:hypothetical protein
MMLAFSRKENNNLRVDAPRSVKYARRSLCCNSYSIGEVFSGSTDSWRAFERPFVPPRSGSPYRGCGRSRELVATGQYAMQHFSPRA